jgi:hypothetical protein
MEMWSPDVIKTWESRDLEHLNQLWADVYNEEMRAKRREELVKNSIELMNEYFRLVQEEEKSQITDLSAKLATVSQEVTRRAQGLGLHADALLSSANGKELLYDKLNRLVETSSRLSKVRGQETELLFIFISFHSVFI